MERGNMVRPPSSPASLESHRSPGGRCASIDKIILGGARGDSNSHLRLRALLSRAVQKQPSVTALMGPRASSIALNTHVVRSAYGTYAGTVMSGPLTKAPAATHACGSPGRRASLDPNRSPNLRWVVVGVTVVWARGRVCMCGGEGVGAV